mmetsp:Transcript_17239/g.32909  ORF Transcript_17239/g.32909 Transcript_17239/m.32909 type:complete len:209 (-) Transcript_17239:201-827(-)
MARHIDTIRPFEPELRQTSSNLWGRASSCALAATAMAATGGAERFWAQSPRLKNPGGGSGRQMAACTEPSRWNRHMRTSLTTVRVVSFAKPRGMGVSVESGGGLICSRPFQTTPLRSLLAALSEIEQLLASTFKVRSENSSWMLGNGCVKDHALQVELPVPEESSLLDHTHGSSTLAASTRSLRTQSIRSRGGLSWPCQTTSPRATKP